MTGFSSPNHTQCPNDLLDKYMAEMGEAELKVVLAAMRKTLGYHKTKDAISLSQFMKLTGLARQSVIRGIELAVSHGFIKQVGTGARGVAVFELNIEDSEPLVNVVDQSQNVTSTSLPTLPVTSKRSRPTKEKGNKKKEIIPKSLTYPKNRVQWTAEHYRQYGNEHPVVNALAALDSDDLKPTLSQLVKVVASDCVELFEELERFAVSPDDYSDLLAYTLKHSKRKEYSIFKRMTYCLNTWLKGEEESADPYAHLPDIDYGAEMARMGITEIIR